MTPEQLREWAADWELAGYATSVAEPFRAHAAALEEIERLKVMAASAHIERDVHAAMIIRAERAEAALADAERKIGRLKFHAEAMADALSAWVEIEVKEVAAYRAEFKEG